MNTEKYYDLISEGPNPRKINQNNTIIKNDLISEHQSYTTNIDINNQPKSFISTDSKPPQPIESIFKKETTAKTEIQKSINAPKLKESKLKKITKIISTTLIIASILTGLVASGAKLTQKINMHNKTETIKIELVEDFDRQLEELGLSNENLEKIIPLLNREFVEKNLFQFYLKTNNNYEIMTKVANKINYATFGEYVKDLGYIEIDRDESGIIIGAWPSYTQYENAMEAKALKEKNSTEQQAINEFQSYSKGAK